MRYASSSQKIEDAQPLARARDGAADAEKQDLSGELTPLLPPAPPALRAAPMRYEEGILTVLSYPLQPQLNLDALTEGEAAVVLLVLMGLSNAAISGVRNVTERTVANQLASAYRKLGGVSRSCLRQALVMPEGRPQNVSPARLR